MSEKISLVLLIDDNKDDNYVHRYEIAKTKLAEQVAVCNDGPDALQFLRKTLDKSGPESQLPDLIFLDLNLPGMDGWEFLDEFGKLTISKDAIPVIIILSTSQNPDDLARAQRYDIVSEYQVKPLSEAMMRAIVSKYFFNPPSSPVSRSEGRMKDRK